MFWKIMLLEYLTSTTSQQQKDLVCQNYKKSGQLCVNLGIRISLLLNCSMQKAFYASYMYLHWKLSLKSLFHKYQHNLQPRIYLWTFPPQFFYSSSHLLFHAQGTKHLQPMGQLAIVGQASFFNNQFFLWSPIFLTLQHQLIYNNWAKYIAMYCIKNSIFDWHMAGKLSPYTLYSDLNELCTTFKLTYRYCLSKKESYVINKPYQIIIKNIEMSS